MLYNKPFDQTNPDAGYVNGNPATNTAGSIPCAEGLEYPQREIVNAITSAGLAPSNGDLFQLWKAMLAAAKSFVSTIFITGGRAKNWQTPGTYSWTVPAGVTVIEIELWGGGGSGAGGQQGYGGGPGGYSKGAFAVTPGQVLPIIVGAGGAPSSGDSGNYGGTTSVGALIYGNGGGPAINSSGLGGVPGTSDGGSVNVTASRGGGAAYNFNGTYGQGAGGGAPFGGAPGQVGLNANGADGVFPGGGSNGSSLAGGSSGRGGAGFVIIRY